METYQRILLAVDLSPASLRVGERARALAAAFDAELRILHVIEPLPPVLPMPPESIAPEMVTTQAQLLEVAQEQIGKLAQELGVPDGRWNVVVGRTKGEIVRAAAEGGMDLIVIGNRERHGLALLFKATEDVVVHNAACDVLAVRLSEQA